MVASNVPPAAILVEARDAILAAAVLVEGSSHGSSLRVPVLDIESTP